MVSIEVSSHFEAAPEQVWNFIFADRSARAVAASRLVARFEDYEMRTDGTPRYRMIMKVGPATMSAVSDYTVFDRPRRTENRVLENPIGGRFVVELLPADGGTRVTERWHPSPRSTVVRRLMPLLAPVVRSQLQKDLNRWAAAVSER